MKPLVSTLLIISLGYLLASRNLPTTVYKVLDQVLTFNFEEHAIRYSNREEDKYTDLVSLVIEKNQNVQNGPKGLFDITVHNKVTIG
jgi:hypothetical protein